MADPERPAASPDPHAGATQSRWPVAAAGVEDAEALAELIAGGGASGWDGAAVRAEFGAAGARIWCVEPSSPRGVLFARLIADAVHVFNIAVRADSRRQGVAAALMTRAIEAAAEEGDGSVLLEVGADNAPALGLYAALGFVVVGRRPRYYPGGEDAVLMTRMP